MLGVYLSIKTNSLTGRNISCFTVFLLKHSFKTKEFQRREGLNIRLPPSHICVQPVLIAIGIVVVGTLN